MSTLKIITDEDLANKGVMPLADVPGLSAEDMKYKFEEIVRAVVITTLNQNMQLLEDAVFVDPQSHTYYLRASDLLTTYQSIIDNGDAGKIAAAVAVKEMDAALKESITTLETTVGGSTSGLVKQVNDLDTTIGDNDSGLVKQVNDLDTDVNGELGLKTQVNYLQNVVFVVFRPNGADGGSMPQVTRIPNSLGNIVLPNGCTYTYTGHTFSGWSLTDSGSVDYASGATVSNVADLLAGNVLELFAVWS